MNVDERKVWRMKAAEERVKLREDLEREHGVVGHEKASLLFDLAWEYGHSSGLEEIQRCYSSFVDLLHRGPA